MKPIPSLEWDNDWWRNAAKFAIPASFFLIGIGYCTLRPQPKNAPVFKTGAPLVDSSKIKKKGSNSKPAKVKSDVGLVKIDDVKPYIPLDVTAAMRNEYIKKHSQIAVSEMDKYGIPASIILAQAGLEGKWGTSLLARRDNNHFGVKCFSKSCPPGHCTNHTDDHHKDFFRKYKSSWESYREHSQFLMKYRYRELLQYGKNYKLWAKGLKDFGYATDPDYDRKLIQIIEAYGLNKLDDL